MSFPHERTRGKVDESRCCWPSITRRWRDPLCPVCPLLAAIHRAWQTDSQIGEENVQAHPKVQVEPEGQGRKEVTLERSMSIKGMFSRSKGSLAQAEETPEGSKKERQQGQQDCFNKETCCFLLRCHWVCKCPTSLRPPRWSTWLAITSRCHRWTPQNATGSDFWQEQGF